MADEVRYIQHRAANHDGRIVTIGQLVLFSTETGDAWLLDRTDFLAARLARDGEVEPVQIVETATTFTIEWKGSYIAHLFVQPNAAAFHDPLAQATLDGF